MTHNKKITTAPDSTGLSVLVALKEQNPNLPKEYELDTLIPVGHCDTFPTIESSSREVKEYEPINDRDFTSIISTGPIKYDEISLTALYDPSGSDGVNELYKAYKKNDEIGLVIELYDNGDDTGTLYSFLVKVTKLSITSEKGGKVACDISAKIIGEPVVTAKENSEAAKPVEGDDETPADDTPEIKSFDIYYGAYDADAIDEVTAKTLTKIKQTSLNGVYEIGEDGTPKYLYIIYPKELGDINTFRVENQADNQNIEVVSNELSIDGVEYYAVNTLNELEKTTISIA